MSGFRVDADVVAGAGTSLAGITGQSDGLSKLQAALAAPGCCDPAAAGACQGMLQAWISQLQYLGTAGAQLSSSLSSGAHVYSTTDRIIAGSIPVSAPG